MTSGFRPFSWFVLPAATEKMLHPAENNSCLLTLPDFPNFHLPSPISQFDFDAAFFPAHIRRMAKKPAASVGQASSLSPKSKMSETGKMPVLRSSSLLDTRVVYCGDNPRRAHRKEVGAGWSQSRARGGFFFSDRYSFHTSATIIASSTVNIIKPMEKCPNMR